MRPCASCASEGVPAGMCFQKILVHCKRLLEHATWCRARHAAAIQIQAPPGGWLCRLLSGWQMADYAWHVSAHRDGVPQQAAEVAGQRMPPCIVRPALKGAQAFGACCIGDTLHAGRGKQGQVEGWPVPECSQASPAASKQALQVGCGISPCPLRPPLQADLCYLACYRGMPRLQVAQAASSTVSGLNQSASTLETLLMPAGSSPHILQG